MLIPSTRTYFCSVCATQREVPKRRSPTMQMGLISLLWGALFGASAYLVFGMPWGPWIAFLSTLLCFMILEVYYGGKFKRELVCPVCQFDPVLYRRSPDQAKKRCLENVGKNPLGKTAGAPSNLSSHWQALTHQKTESAP